MALSELPYMERLIIRRIVQSALEAGYLVSTHDGEEWVLIASADETAICRSIGETEYSNLRFRDPKKPDVRGNPGTVGTVHLVHGLHHEVIADATDNPETEAVLALAVNLAERLAA